MRVKTEKLILQCVEDGVVLGIRSARLDPDASLETTEAYLVSAVVARLAEYFTFNQSDWD